MLKSSIKTKPQFANRHLYEQIRDHFVELIASGEWQADRPIDSETDLADSLGCSVGTVRKALDTLEAEGLVTRKQGRGTFIADHSSEALSMRFSNLRIGNGQRVCGLVATCDVVVDVATVDERRWLGLGEQDRVFRATRIRELHGRRFMYETVVISQRQMPLLVEADFSNPRVAAIGARRHNMLAGKAEERVSIAAASGIVAEALGIKVGDPLLLLDRVMFCINGKRLEWRVALCSLHDKYYMADII